MELKKKRSDKKIPSFIFEEYPIDTQERDFIDNPENDIAIITDQHTVQCFLGCWSNREGSNWRNHAPCMGLLFKKFEKHNEKLALGAAKIIQKREEERKALKESIDRADEAVQIAKQTLSESRENTEKTVNIAKKGVRTSTIMVLLSLAVTAIIGIIGVSIELNKSDLSEEVIVIPSLFLFLSVIVVSIVSLIIFNQD